MMQLGDTESQPHRAAGFRLTDSRATIQAVYSSDDGQPPYARVDLRALAAQLEVDLDAAFAQLRDLYDFVDERNAQNTADLDLPCHRGCDACCHESVFLTPVEFFLAWDHLQRVCDDEILNQVIEKGLDVYGRYRSQITALDDPPPEGQADHLEVAREIRFTCPLLGPEGACRVYPVRELYARLFGCTFNEQGGVYGCDLVGAHLGGKTVTLMQAHTPAKRLAELPLTFKRQVYPWYINLLYGPGA